MVCSSQQAREKVCEKVIAMAIAVFPGSFDPPTLGHLDVLERGAALFERVVVGVLQNPAKTPTFSQADRVSVFGEIVENRGLSNVEIREFAGLAVHFAESVGAQWILRGLRSTHDFEFETPMALMNRSFGEGTVETIFLPARPELSHIRGTLVREILKGGGDIAGFVPSEVLGRL